MTLGWAQAVTATAYDDSNNALPAAAITWSSSNSQVVSVSSTGTGARLLATSVGTATITATARGGAQATTTVQVVIGDTLVWDTFSGPDGTSLASHAPDANAIGSGWVLAGGAAALSANTARAVAQSNASAVAYATVGSGATDVRLAANWIAQGATPWSGFVLRWSDADNFLFGGYNALTSELAVYRVRGGSWTRLVGAPVAVSAGSTHQLEMAAVGPSLKLYWDGTLMLDTSDGYNIGVLRHGIAWAPGVDALSAYDTFRLTGVAAAPPPSPPTPTPSPAPDDGSSSAPQAPSAPTVVSGSVSSAPSSPPRPSSMQSSVSGSTVLLQWAPPSGFAPAGYILEAGTASGLADQASFELPPTSTSYVVEGVVPGVYFVRVRARAADGQISAASNETIATVGMDAPVCSAAASAPTDVSFAVDGSTVWLTWTPADRAVSYVVEAGSAPGLSNIAYIETQSDAAIYTSYGVDPGTYHVRIRAKNECGAASEPSSDVVIQVGR
jgi:hypothetical protein